MHLTVGNTVKLNSLSSRALKTVMVPRFPLSAYFTSDLHSNFFFQLYNQKRPSTRSRQDREGGPSRTPDTNGNSGSGGAGDQPPTARPRGMSDALIRPSESRQIGGGGVVRGGNVTTTAKDGRLHTSESIYG
jgi:hypothetical protein